MSMAVVVNMRFWLFVSDAGTYRLSRYLCIFDCIGKHAIGDERPLVPKSIYHLILRIGDTYEINLEICFFGIWFKHI